MKRTPLRKVSKSKKRDNSSYSSQRKSYLTAHPICEICIAEEHKKPRKATEIHHTESRRGDAYLDEDTWLAVCNPNGCHSLVHFGGNKKLHWDVPYYNEFLLWRKEFRPFDESDLTYGPTWARFRGYLK